MDATEVWLTLFYFFTNHLEKVGDSLLVRIYGSETESQL